MLILTRRVGESLMVGDDIVVTVLEVKGNQVRIGIDAPRVSRCTGARSTSASRRGSPRIRERVCPRRLDAPCEV